MLIIGDVHGSLRRLEEMLRIAPTDQGVCLVGDLVDRGPSSREVVELVKTRGYHCVLGNHDQMLADVVKGRAGVSGLYNWGRNGAASTALSYGVDLWMMHNQGIMTPILREHADWIDSLPHYIEFPELQDGEGRHLVVSHSTILPYWEKKDTPEAQEGALWYRPEWDFEEALLDNMDKGFVNIIGHTIVPDLKPRRKGNILGVDTAGFHPQGFLSAILWPSLEVFQVGGEP